MTTFGAWKQALGVQVTNDANITTRTYSAIKEMGLTCVDWESFDPACTDDIKTMLQSIHEFMQTKKPCLFIYDPKVPKYRKGYLFGVQNPSPIEQWICDNNHAMQDHSYLITTQVENHGRGFVGSVFSDGKGMLLCETLHSPNVANQRELSQPKKDTSKHIDGFTLEDHELTTWRGRKLALADINTISTQYAGLEGYFEFVYGMQSGRIELVTTGYEPFAWPLIFPYAVLDNCSRDASLRKNAAILKHN
jgi:hypothetical protein